jgi:hypothetical protein
MRKCVEALESWFVEFAEFIEFVELKQAKKSVSNSMNDLGISHWSLVTCQKQKP